MIKWHQVLHFERCLDEDVQVETLAAGIEDVTLMMAAIEVRAGVYEADLGGGVFKKRIARAGGGKSGGFRTVVICSNTQFTVFVYGFAKSDAADLSPDQVAAFKQLAKQLRAYPLRWA